jgi:hypothetical protein
MDATEFGIQFLFLILIPGLVSGVGFRLTAGLKTQGGDFASMCYAALFGAIIFAIWKSSLGSNTGQLAVYIADPITTGISLAVVGFVLGLIIGIPVGWIRWKMR